MNILIIEDEFALADVIREILLEENYNVDISTDGLKGYNMLCNKLYDLIILDVMLPNMDGFEILKRIRNENINSKVIMLTAKSIELVLDNKLTGDSYATSLVNSISDNSNINFNGYKLYVNGIAIN